MRINLTAFPYDSEVIRYEKDGTPVYDRAVDSKVFRNIFLRYFTEGVDPNGGFTIVENSTQGALVKKGWANIRGVFIELKEDTAITFEAADSMDRIDRVILRHDDAKTVRKPDVIILKGTPSNSPQAPNITRNETQYDIVLADVRIRANSSVVTNTQITSQRLNTDLCGIITGTIKEVNTNDLYNQIKSDLSQFKESEQTEFLEWFESIKGKLGEDLAGNLQLQIDDLDSRTDVLEEATFTGEFSQVKSEFSGSASDYGIEVARIEGAYKQDGTPTPEQPIEPHFFHATSFNTNGGNLFDASKLPTKSQGGATVTNNGDGSFTVVGSGEMTGFSQFYTYPKDLAKILLKVGTLKGKTEAITNPIYTFGVYDNKGTPVAALYGNAQNPSVSITEDMISKIESGEYILREYFYGENGKSIKEGTIKPVVYQEGDGTFYPFNASSTPVDIELRALPNGVKDTCENGVITKKVRYIKFDGSDDEKWTLQSINEYGIANFVTPLNPQISESNITFLSNRFKKQTTVIDKTTDEGIFINEVNQLYIRINKSRLTSQDTAGFKLWLKSNVTEVWYSLETPTTEQINIPILKSFYPFTNAWCDSELQSNITWNALTGRSSILDGLGNLIKEAPMTAPRNLLINGDFQINQRGKSEYGENGYTLDMWNCILTNGNKLSQLPSGYGVLINKVKAKQTVLRQRNPNVSKYPVGTKFTAVYDFESNVSFSNEVRFGKQIKSIQVEAKRKQYSFTWTLQSNDIDENKNVDVLVFNNIDTNVQLKVHSVRLFEGEIAYKGQKEDKTLSLTRCLPFCERAKFTVTATGSYFMNGFSYKMSKENNPIINILSVANSDGAVNKEDFSFSVIDKYFANFIRYKNGSCESLKNNVYTFDVLVTCEPL